MKKGINKSILFYIAYINAVALWIVFCKYCSHRIPSPYHLINQ